MKIGDNESIHNYLSVCEDALTGFGPHSRKLSGMTVFLHKRLSCSCS